MFTLHRGGQKTLYVDNVVAVVPRQEMQALAYW